MNIQKIRYEVVTGKGTVISAHRIQRCAFQNKNNKAWRGAKVVRKVGFDAHGKRHVLRTY